MPLRSIEVTSFGTVLRRPSAFTRAANSENANGLMKIIVGAGLKPGNPVFYAAESRQHQHGRADGGRADPLDDGYAVELRQHPIDDRNVELLGREDM